MTEQNRTDGNSLGGVLGPPSPGAVVPTAVIAHHYRPWLPMAVTAGLTGFLLVLLNLPGVLKYPGQQPVSGDDGRRTTVLEEHNRSLREQIEQARQLAGRNVCVHDGRAFERPQLLPSQIPGAPSQPPGAGVATARALPPEQGAMLPRPPESNQLPRNSVPNFEGSLAELLDRATVLVVAHPSGVGSGFFVSPRHIVTNRHVVDAGTTFFVTNKQLGGVKPARLLVKSPPGDPGAIDYAVLEIDALPQAPPALLVSATAARLQRVVAAGFPGVVTQSDQKLAALKGGDRSAIPDLVLTQGSITVVQNRETSNPIIGHQANISPGNSGGPLVDDCARAVGVNTYGVFDTTGKHSVNYALGAASLIAFLKANNVPHQVADSACQQTATSVPAEPARSASPATTPRTDAPGTNAPAAKVPEAAPASPPAAPATAPQAAPSSPSPAVPPPTAPPAQQPEGGQKP